jgi:hypothetical protein
MTLLTDYVLAGLTGWLGWRLFSATEDQTARSLWALAFAALATAAALGGSYHGFARSPVVWTVTVLVIGVASFAMLAGSAIAVTSGRLRKLLLALATAKFVLYSLWMLAHEDFIFVIADTGFAMALVAALHAWSATSRRDRASLWMLGGVAVSVFAAGVQASGYTLDRHFSHNDLFHVIQMGAMTLFYVGAARLRDSPKREGKE